MGNNCRGCYGRKIDMEKITCVCVCVAHTQLLLICFNSNLSRKQFFPIGNTDSYRKPFFLTAEVLKHLLRR